MDKVQFETLAVIERRHIELVCSATANVRAAAKVLGLSPNTLYRRLAEYSSQDQIEKVKNEGQNVKA